MTTDRFADDPTAWIPRAERPQPTPTVLAALAGAVLTTVLYLGAQTGTLVFAGFVLAVQLLLVGTWCAAARPPAAIGVAAVAVGTALAADGVAALGADATVAPFAGVIAAAFGATIISQLVRGVSRRQVTDAFGSTMTLVVGVVSLASTISLHRQLGGPALLSACLGAAGAGLVVARLGDLVVPRPTVNFAVPRGAIGVLAGSLAGVATAALSASLTDPLSVPLAALIGGGVSLAAILADVGVAFAGTGRAMVESPRPPSPWRPVLGPLLGIAVAAPAAYVFSLILFV